MTFAPLENASQEALAVALARSYLRGDLARAEELEHRGVQCWGFEVQASVIGARVDELTRDAPVTTMAPAARSAQKSTA